MNLEQIGPYRIVKPLGVGGMGEVYLAHDERLERSVALKWVRSDVVQNSKIQQRLIREARAAASLNHPSIVQIHDILEIEEGHCIVMEWVDGVPLSNLLKEGPLPTEQLLPLARELAGGLAEAHQKGILHRDLKAANIMIASSGHAKILDFGLAKRLRDSGKDISLTGDGELLGTCYAMSPEQIQGHTLDARSDLFSLGVLLYEASTGRRPFVGINVPETLRRILTSRQLSAQEWNPEIPTVLSDLIDQLLEKNPRHRPPSARAVTALIAQPISGSLPVLSDEETLAFESTSAPAIESAPTPEQTPSSSISKRIFGPRQVTWLSVMGLALLAVGIGYLLQVQSAEPPPEPIYIAVLNPELTTSDALPFASALLGSTVRLATVRTLVHLEQTIPLANEYIDAVEGTPLKVARAVAADQLLTANLNCSSLHCDVELKRLESTTGGVLNIHTFSLPIDDLPLLDSAMAQNVLGLFPDVEPTSQIPTKFDIEAADYESFLQARLAFQTRPDAKTLSQYSETLRLIQKTSPNFVEAYLLQAQILRMQYEASRKPADLEAAFAVLEAARTVSPEDPRPLLRQFTLDIAANRLDRAAEVLVLLESSRPGDVTVLNKRAILEDRRGHPERALALIEKAVVRQPSWFNFYHRAQIAYRQGKLILAKKSLEEVLDRFPEHFQSLSFLAQIELLSGHPQAVPLYQELVQRSPSHRELSNLGTALLIMKRYDEAATFFRRALEMEPENGRTLLSLAQTENLQGHDASSLFQESLRLQKDLEDPSTLLHRGLAFAFLGEKRQATSEVRKALQRESPHPFHAYQASLIHALTGDPYASMANMELALEMQLGPRWFALPWFDGLRQDPDFRQLLEKHGGAEFLSARPAVEPFQKPQG